MIVRQTNKINKLLLFIVVLFLIICNACTNKNTSVNDIRDYILHPNNGLYHANKINNIKTEILYKPSDLIIANQIEDKNFNKEILDSLKYIYQSHSYFNLHFSYKNQELLSQLKDRNYYSFILNEFSFNMYNHIFIVTNKFDTVYLSDYSFLPTYNYSNKNSFLLAFESNEIRKAKDFQVIVDEFGLKTNKQVFEFQTTDIKKTPLLNFVQKK